MKQLSVFLENRIGELIDITTTLKNAKISIDTITIAETENYGVIRIITSMFEEAKRALDGAGFSSRIVEVIAIEIENRVGEFDRIIQLLSSARININYCYSYYCAKDMGVFIFSLSDNDGANLLLRDAGFKIL